MTGLIKTATRSDVAGNATRGDSDLNLRTDGSDRAGGCSLVALAARDGFDGPRHTIIPPARMTSLMSLDFKPLSLRAILRRSMVCRTTMYVNWARRGACLGLGGGRHDLAPRSTLNRCGALLGVGSRPIKTYTEGSEPGGGTTGTIPDSDASEMDDRAPCNYEPMIG